MSYLGSGQKTRAARPIGTARCFSGLLQNLGDDARTDRLPSLTDGETLLLLEGNGLDELHGEGDGISRHHHLGSLRQRYLAGHVGRTDVDRKSTRLNSS